MSAASTTDSTRRFPGGVPSGLSPLNQYRLPGGASRLAALLVAYIYPICALLAPCDPGAALRQSVMLQRTQTTSRIGFRAAVLVVLLLSWWWIVAMARDMYGAMDGPSAWMMTPVWDVPHLLLLWTMWAVMMAAMMLPSAWPMLAMFGTFADSQPSSPRHAAPLYWFAAGYVLVWAPSASWPPSCNGCWRVGSCCRP